MFFGSKEFSSVQVRINTDSATMKAMKDGHTTPAIGHGTHEPEVSDDGEGARLSRSSEANGNILNKSDGEITTAMKKKDKDIKELHKYYNELLQKGESVHRDLQGRNDLLVNAINDQEIHTTNQATMVAAIQREVLDLRNALAQTQKELAVCRDELFQLQPTVHTPDTEILEAFEDICEQIVNWLDEEMSAFEKAHPTKHVEQLFSTSKSSDTGRFLHENPEAGEHLLRYLVHKVIDQTIFEDKVYQFGISKQTNTALQKMMESMRELNPPRDYAAINKWRSETLNALVATEESAKLREQQAQGISRDIFHLLGETFPSMFRQHANMTKFHEKVTLCALKLVSKLQLSTSEYSFVFPAEIFAIYKPVYHRHLGPYKFVDIKTRKTLKPSSPVVANETGRIGKIVVPLEPGLDRMNGSEAEIRLRPNAYLVRLDHSLKKNAPHKSG